MNIALWILQVLLGVYFVFVGVNHFVLPPGLPEAMGWMYELSPGLHYFSGIAEILGGLGLILPGAFKIQTRLTPLAALGLVLVMIGAMAFKSPSIKQLWAMIKVSMVARRGSLLTPLPLAKGLSTGRT